MTALVDEASFPHLANFVDTVAELIAAILDVHFGVAERNIAAVDVGYSGHRRSDDGGRTTHDG
jgi:hypothetical protein